MSAPNLGQLLPLGPLSSALSLAAPGIPFWNLQNADASTVNSMLVMPSFGGAEGETFSSDPWSLVTMTGPAGDVFMLPGISDVKGSVAVAIDHKKVKGSNGTRLTVVGYKPSMFAIDVHIWTQPQWDAFCAVLISLWTATKDIPNAREPLQVAYPFLPAYGVHVAVIEEIGFPRDGRVPGEKIVSFKMFESVPPKKTSKKVTKTIGPSVVPQLAQTAAQKSGFKNAVPEPPSANLRPGGPPAAPQGGAE